MGGQPPEPPVLQKNVGLKCQASNYCPQTPARLHWMELTADGWVQGGGGWDLSCKISLA